jgi:hypothetical protein
MATTLEIVDICLAASLRLNTSLTMAQPTTTLAVHNASNQMGGTAARWGWLFVIFIILMHQARVA